MKIFTGILVLSTLLFACNKNEYAPEIVGQEFAVEENSPSGTIIGMVEASDQDEGQSLAFEIVDGNDDGLFEIDYSRGTLTIDDPTNLDYERFTQVVLVVSVSDEHNKEPLESSALIYVNLEDINEFAPHIETQDFTMDENPISGQEIGSIVAADPEPHQKVYYQLAGAQDDGFVSIDSITGMLSVLDSAGFDYEANQNLTVTIAVSDNHENPMTAEAEITIYLNDIPEEQHLYLNLQPDGVDGKDALFGKIVPDNNYADSEELHIYAWTHDGIITVNRVVMDFDLSSIPANARIDSAYISLFFNTTSAYGVQHEGENSFIIQRIISDWDESTVTWNTQPTPTSANQLIVAGATQPFQSFPELNITTLVQDYISDPGNSYGMLIRLLNEEPYKILLFASSDHANPYLRPRLDVFYTVVQ